MSRGAVLAEKIEGVHRGDALADGSDRHELGMATMVTGGSGQ